jgi:hypothetical protein
MVLASVVVAAALGEPALAERAPTSTEAAGIARAFHAPASCLTIRISTVDPVFAHADWRSPLPARCDRYALDGAVTLLRRHGATWTILFSASGGFHCSDVPAPAAVKRDLHFPGC